MPASRVPVRRKEAPVVPVDYRFDMSRRSVGQFASAAVAIVVLVFLSGLVIGVRLNLGTAVATEQTDAPGAESPAEPVISDGAESGGAEAGATAETGDPETDGTGGATEASGAEPTGAGISVADPPAGSVVAPVANAITTAEPTPPNTGDSAESGNGPFTLQVGAFRSPENADALLASMTASGYDARITMTTGSEGELSRVVIGQYATEAEAERGATRFRADTGREVYVMTATEVGL